MAASTKTFDIDPYLNARGVLRVTVRRAHRIEHAGATVAILDRAQVEALVADLLGALAFDDTAGEGPAATDEAAPTGPDTIPAPADYPSSADLGDE